MNKLTSYQKLKLENEQLKKDIYNLVRKADQEEGIEVRCRYSMIYDFWDIVMVGSRTTDDEDDNDGFSMYVNKPRSIGYSELCKNKDNE